MARIGFHASLEQFSPRRLLEWVALAEDAGFQAAMCSDHFHPWSERRGSSGFAWSWLGAALRATHLTFGTVTSPGQRYHPAVIAQAAATLAEMFPGRLWVAAGSGEHLNEGITGDPWPDKAERNARLLECVEVMRRLWAGETVTADGRIRVRDATLHTLPERPPLLLGAAVTPRTAEWVGGWADGLITVAAEPPRLREVIDAFRSGGGAGKPIHLQAAISFARTDEEALRAAHEEWPIAALGADALEDLRTPRAFDEACQAVPPEALVGKLRISHDLKRHLEWLRGDIELGASEIYLHHVGRDIERFLDAFGEHILPELEIVPV